MKLVRHILVCTTLIFSCYCLSFYYSSNPACNGQKSSKFIWSTLEDVSKIRCVLSCDTEVMCVLVSYNTETRVCYLHTNTLFDVSPTMVPDSNYVCLLPTDFLQSWVKNIIASSPHHDEYITDFLIGEKDFWPWIPQVAATAFVEFEIAVDMYVERVYIYEAYSSVGYSDISLRDPAGDWVAVWSGLQVPQTQGDRIFSPELKKTNFKTSVVRLDIILGGVKEYVDAVKVVGKNNLRLRA